MDILDDMGVSKLSAKVNYSSNCFTSIMSNIKTRQIGSLDKESLLVMQFGLLNDLSSFFSSTDPVAHMRGSYRNNALCYTHISTSWTCGLQFEYSFVHWSVVGGHGIFFCLANIMCRFSVFPSCQKFKVQNQMCWWIHDWNSFSLITAQSFKEFSQLLNTVEEERRRLVSCFVSVQKLFLVHLFDK